MTITCNKCK